VNFGGKIYWFDGGAGEVESGTSSVGSDETFSKRASRPIETDFVRRPPLHYVPRFSQLVGNDVRSIANAKTSACRTQDQHNTLGSKLLAA